MQTQIRLLLRVYTVCHSVCIVWTHYSMVEPRSSNFRVMTTNILDVRIFRKLKVLIQILELSFCDHSNFRQSKYGTVLTAKHLKHGYRYQKLRKAFPQFYCRHFDLVANYNASPWALMNLGISESEFYVEFVINLGILLGNIFLSEQS